MIIGEVYNAIEKEGLKVSNVPYKVHDYPCHEGCCDNELSVGIGTLYRVYWLLDHYLPNNKMTEFDYQQWTEEQETLVKKYRERKQ